MVICFVATHYHPFSSRYGFKIEERNGGGRNVDTHLITNCKTTLAVSKQLTSWTRTKEQKNPLLFVHWTLYHSTPLLSKWTAQINTAVVDIAKKSTFQCEVLFLRMLLWLLWQGVCQYFQARMSQSTYQLARTVGVEWKRTQQSSNKIQQGGIITKLCAFVTDG